MNIIESMHLQMIPAAKKGDIEQVVSCLKDLEALGIKPAAKSINILMKACNQSKQPELAFKAFTIMKSLKVTPDVWTYNTLLHSCSLQKKISLAQSLFEEMLKQKVKPDNITYNTIVDAAVKAKKFKVARRFFLEGNLLKGCIKGASTIDCHWLSHGAACVAIAEHITTTSDVKKFLVISGIGNHSGRHLEMRSFVQKFVKRYFSEKWKLSSIPYNPGAFKITVLK